MGTRLPRRRVGSPLPHFRWVVRPEASAEEAARLGPYHPLVRRLLFNRGVGDEAAAKAFLTPQYPRGLHDPYAFPHLRRAATRILAAVSRHEPIAVYGDYDADGVCATAVLTDTLTALGAAPSVYIPFRQTEGYGLNAAAVEKLAADGVKVIITVDCGTSNVEEVAVANARGMDVIIADHHATPPALPAALAVLNPKLPGPNYPNADLCGTGVAFTLARGLLDASQHGVAVGHPVPAGFEKWLLDLVAIATVADLMPLTGENRVLTHFGLLVLRRTRRVGLAALIRDARREGRSVDESFVAFHLAPRLNAAGRMNHASEAYQLLVTSDADEAARLTDRLRGANEERQRSTERILSGIFTRVPQPPPPVIVLADDGWPTGVLGPVASKVAEAFDRPTFLLGRANGQLTGSGRSPGGIHLTETLRKVSDLLLRFGGHADACGLTLKEGVTGEQLAHALGRAVGPPGEPESPVLRLDAEVDLEDISDTLVSDLETLKPYGEGVPPPRFVSRQVTVERIEQVGREAQHLRLFVRHRTTRVRKTIGFRFGAAPPELTPGATIDLAYEVGLEEWNGKRDVRLEILDIHPTPSSVRRDPAPHPHTA
jgi:single-stranded-DNA-specific exonuclease